MGNLVRLSTPVYLREKLPPNRRTFLFTVFRHIKCRKNRYSNSFFAEHFGITSLLILNISPTFDGLINHLTALFRPDAKPTFGFHDPIGLRILFQLSVILSPLLSHKKPYNFIDTPSDICHCNQGIEDTSHFLFSSPSCVIERAALMSNVNEILQKMNLNHLRNQLKLYLYGHSAIINSDNRKF